MRHHLHRVTAEEGPLAVRAAGPMQHGRAGEVPAGADDGQPGQQLQRIPVPERDVRSHAHDVALVCLWQVDRDVAECVAPFVDGGVVVRMREGDGLDPAATFDLRHRGFVEVGQRLPEDVSAIGLDEEGALADGEFGLGDDAGNAGLDRIEAVVIVGAHLREGGPLLAVGTDVLPVILADGAVFRRIGAGWELRAAGDADVGGVARFRSVDGGF